MDTREARELAESKELDLVEVAANADPPVARIMDFGKFQYEQSKAKGPQKKPKAGLVKEIRLTMRIGEHDLRYRLQRAAGFLAEGSKVRFNLMMKGRENANPRAAMERVRQYAGLLDGVKVESEPVRAGRSISMVVTHDKKSRKDPHIKDELPAE